MGVAIASPGHTSYKEKRAILDNLESFCYLLGVYLRVRKYLSKEEAVVVDGFFQMTI